jgi:catechol 2,3-dioxygenase-like lactoylglutathione lyase family enzyme
MTDRLITHLRHVDLAVPDYDTEYAFYTGLWGLTPTATDTGLGFLAAEGSPEQYVVRLRQAADKRIDLIAFGAATRADVDTLAASLGTGDVPLVHEPKGPGHPGRRLRVPVLRQRGPDRRGLRPTWRPGSTAGSRRGSRSRSGSRTWW